MKVTKEEATKKYLDYLEGHIGNVAEALELFIDSGIPYVVENADRLRDIVKEHDKSKYEEPEWTGYLHHFYPTSEEDSLKIEEFDEATRHHVENNKHHWNYWVKDNELVDDIDEEEYKLYCVERCADWCAMSIQNDNDVLDWYNANKASIKMPEYGYSLCEEILKAVPRDYDLSYHGTRTEGKPEREVMKESEYIDRYRVEDIERGSYEGYTYYSLIAYNENNSVGRLDYYKVDNEYHIENLIVYDEYKRQGVGTYLCIVLQKKIGDQDIYFDLIVPNSLGYWKTVADIEEYKQGAFGVPYYKGRIKREVMLREHLLGLNREYIKKLGKRAKIGNNGTAVSIKPTFSSTFDEVIEKFKEEDERRLDEYGNSGYIGNSKSVRAAGAEAEDKYPATEAAKLLGVQIGAIKDLMRPSEWHHTGSYYQETNYYDIRLLLAIKNSDEEVMSEYDDEDIAEAKTLLSSLKSWKKPEVTSKRYIGDMEWLTWSGTRKHPKAEEHRLNDIEVEERGSFYYFNDEHGRPIKKKIDSNGTNLYIKKRIDESMLLEVRASQMMNKTKSEDPARVERSRRVSTKYIGMSKFGVLNFKTTSETRPGGYHYQTVEFQSLKPFETIIKQGKEIMPNDIKKELADQDLNVFCSDESWSYWAWYYQAYQNDYAYIDDNIPNLDKRIQAPKVNNVRLKGALCKHLVSVFDYLKRPFVLYAISEDIKKYLTDQDKDKMHSQDIGTQNWYDAVAQWNEEDIKDYTGMSREQIVADLSKSIEVNPNIELDDYLEDIAKETLEKNGINRDTKLERQIVDKVKDELDLEDEYDEIKRNKEEETDDIK